MKQSELRQKLFDFFDEKEIDYDQSQNTLNLYRWAVRNHSFEQIEEIEKLIDEKKQAKKLRESEQIKAEKEAEKQAEIEAEKQAEIEVEKQENKNDEPKKPKKDKQKKVEKDDDDPVNAEIIKDKEIKKEETQKNDWIFYLLILAFLAYLVFNFLKNRENATDEQPGE